MALLALIRHGESVWNKEQKFSGWHDVLLTSKGEEEMKAAASKLRNYHFDLAFSSELTRAKNSLTIILKELDLPSIPTQFHHGLDERDYGDLTGKTHQEIIHQFGKKQYDLWHRSWDHSPPHGESLKDTHTRVWNYFQEQILPELKKGKNILIVASGNSLRALRKGLDNISEERIPFLEIPTGSVEFYEVDAKGNAVKIS